MVSEANYILAIDQGTTSTRSIIFEDGIIKSNHAISLNQSFPQKAYVEHNPDEIFTSTVETIKQVIIQAKIDAKEIKAIGITNQRETTVIWDRETGKPLYPAIVWQDRRTSDWCLKNKDKEPMIKDKTGLVLDPYFCATKIAWILDTLDLRQQAKDKKLCFGTIDSYLLFKLTGNHFTDTTNASRTMLFNIHTLEWDKELLELFNIPIELMPNVKPSSYDFGRLKKDIIGEEIPVTAILGDQHAALFGQGGFDKGELKSTYGTGCFVMLNTGDKITKSENKLLSTVAYHIDKPVYALEGSIFNAGTIVSWLKNEMQLISDAKESELLAVSVKDNHGVYFVPAFTGLGAPYWQPDVHGAIFGISRGTNKAHIVRAGLEAIAYQTRDLLTAMQSDSNQEIKLLKVDGGMIHNKFLMQFMANILDKEIKCAKISETTALGVAYLAGYRVGIYKSLDEIDKKIEYSHKYLPKELECFPKNNERDILYGKWLEMVGRVING